VPDPFKDVMCLKPDDDVIKKYNKATKSKREAKAAVKKKKK
jgi:hypothetical protein